MMFYFYWQKKSKERVILSERIVIFSFRLSLRWANLIYLILMKGPLIYLKYLRAFIQVFIGCWRHEEVKRWRAFVKNLFQKKETVYSVIVPVGCNCSVRLFPCYFPSGTRSLQCISVASISVPVPRSSRSPSRSPLWMLMCVWRVF